MHTIFYDGKVLENDLHIGVKKSPFLKKQKLYIERVNKTNTIDTWTAFAACVDFSANTVKAAINSPESSNEGSATPDFTGLSFTSNSVFRFCADGTGVAFSCQVQFLKTFEYSSAITSLKPYIWGTSRKFRVFIVN